MSIQINSTWLILSMDHTIIEALTLGITSMNMQAMNVTSPCMFSFSCFISVLFFSFKLWRSHGMTFHRWTLCQCRCPNKDEQYHFLRHYLQPENPHEVCEEWQSQFVCTDWKILVLGMHKMGFKLYKCRVFLWLLFSYFPYQQVSEKDLEALYVEENTYTLASHLYWALWGLIQVSLFL